MYRFFSKILPDDIAGVHARSQSMQRLIKSHLGAGHENELSYHAFRAEQVLRFPEEVSQEYRVAEIEEMILVRLWRINLAIKIFGKTDERAASTRQ